MNKLLHSTSTSPLGNSSLQVSSTGANISHEEYYPFGESSFGSYAKKRYKYNGKERDNESGLYYYGARYYNPTTGIFLSVDPLAAEYPFYTPYNYAGNKPIGKIDIDGMQEEGGSPQSGGGDNSEKLPLINNMPTVHVKEVEVTGSKAHTTKSIRYVTSEITESSYNGSMERYRKEQSLPNSWSDSKVRDWWDNAYGNTGAWNTQEAQLIQESRDKNAVKKLSFFAAYFYAIEYVAYVYAPASVFESVMASRLAHGSKIFTYVPRGVNATKGGTQGVNRIYSSRELIRRAAEPGPFHNFPEVFNKTIFQNGTKTITPNYFNVAKPGLSNTNILYKYPGTVNGTKGFFEIGVRPSVSGRTEVIMHRFFNPIR